MLFYNEDWIHYIWTRNNAGIEITKESLKEYIYSFKNSQITDFVMNINGTVSTADSKVFETFADKYMATKENGVAVDFKDTFASEVYKLIYEKKTDMYKVWIETLREIGINPWISVRMNDCHGNMEDLNVRKSSHVERYAKYHIAAHRERTGYFDKCFDYSHFEMRKKMLDYIDEQLDKYDVYGLELDFMRDTFFVRFGEEYGGAPIMAQFIRDIFYVVKKYEAKYGHPIKKSVILPTEPNLTIERGMNIFDFADELDYVVIIPRWETIDTDMPIELWKQLLRNTGIKLGCGQQLLFKPYRGYKPVISTVKMAFGQAIANLSRGCDFVYLYNYMDLAQFEGELADWVYDTSIRNDTNRSLIFKNIGRLDTLMKQERSHVVTYSDFWRYDIPACSVLPIEFNEECVEFKQIKIPVGKVPEQAKVHLIMGISGNDALLPKDIKVYVNAVKCEFKKKTELDRNIYENDAYVFSVGGNMYGVMYAEVNIAKKCCLEYVEIEVVPAES